MLFRFYLSLLMSLVLLTGIYGEDSDSQRAIIEEVETVAESGDSAESADSTIYATAPKGDIAALFYKTKEDKTEKVKLLDEELNKKRKVVVIGNVVLAASLALEYGVILPNSLKLDVDDPDYMSDMIALLSPQILGFMMKTAGTTMASMRTSESIDSYVSITGDAAPNNLSWKLYWAGWGATLISGMVGFVAAVPQLEDYADEIAAASMGIGILSDCIRVANGVYSMMLIKKLKGKAVAIPVRVTPSVGSNGEPGLSMKIKF